MSFFSRLFSRSKDIRSDPFEIVEAYGRVLEMPARGLGGARPIDSLPYDKATIECAILEVAKQNQGNTQVMDALEAGFVSLAYFQDGVQRDSVDLDDLDEMIAKLRLDCDVNDVSADIDKLTGNVLRHSPAIQAELQRLQSHWILEVGDHA